MEPFITMARVRIVVKRNICDFFYEKLRVTMEIY